MAPSSPAVRLVDPDSFPAPGGFRCEEGCGEREDWKRRAEAAQERVAELEREAEERRREHVQVRTERGYWKSQYEQANRKLKALRVEVKESRCREIARLKSLLENQGIDPRERSVGGRLRRENRALREEKGELSERVRELEATLVRMRSTTGQLQKTLFGRKSEQQQKAPSGRARGGQPGAVGHGRTARPLLERREEVREPPAHRLTCPDCGGPYTRNGAHPETGITEIEVKAHVRVIRRPRYRRACAGTGALMEVSAPPPPRVFAGTAYGVSVWARVLVERFHAHRTLNGVARWLTAQGLTISAGTLADALPRLAALFDPVWAAIRARQQSASFLNGDETSWWVQQRGERGGNPRGWLWIARSQDTVAFHIDARRNTEAAGKLFGDLAEGTILVCDRYAVYAALVREMAQQGKTLILAYCWAHVRRDFFVPAAGDLTRVEWRDQWIDRIGQAYHLNRKRLEHYQPERSVSEQNADFQSAHHALREAMENLFTTAQAELADLDPDGLQAKPLRSLITHRTGLMVFVDHPQVPMDNNAAERNLRPAVILRKLSGGSNGETGARLTARMLSVVHTLQANRVPVLPWLNAYLQACAENHGRPPDDLTPWLPWSIPANGPEPRAQPP